MLDVEEIGGRGGEGKLRGEEEGGANEPGGGDERKMEGECERGEEKVSSDSGSSTLHEKLSIERESSEWKGAKQGLEGVLRTNKEILELDEWVKKGNLDTLVEKREGERAERGGGGGQGNRRAEDCRGSGNRGGNPAY